MMKKRNIYLNTVDIEEAQALFHSKFSNFYNKNYEFIPVSDSLNRITASPVFAKISNPHYNASAMDGIAIKASASHGAHERSPVTLEEAVDFIYVDTGDPIPQQYDAVVMIEDVYPNEDGTVNIMKAAYPWEHIRAVGEDIAIGDMILPSKHEVTPADIGAVLSAGVTEIEVHRKLTVGIIPTGTEIVKPGTALKPGSIIDSNSSVFYSLVVENGGIPKKYDPVSDDMDALRDAIMKAVSENDIVIINAGSSAGSEDYTVSLIRELGEVYVHGIAIKPGKPTILGCIHEKAVIGIPGYPVSAFLSFKAFVIPLIQNFDQKSKEKEKLGVTLSRRVVSSLKYKEFVRVKIGKVGYKFVATPLNRGAGVTTSLVKADGILEIPKNVEGFEAGEYLNVELLRSLETIENSLVSIGSHDIIIDYMNDLLKQDDSEIRLASAHVGSLGGIMAVKKEETHIAPIHLLDEKSGTYNIPYIQKYMKGKACFLLKGIKRWQGIYVQKGNPHGVVDLRDISEKKLIFANRQKGSGTRTLLDYKLRQEQIDSEKISGYEKEFTTHTNVATSVLSGNSDVGLGIKSVATMMGLDFIPVALEDYDFLIPKEHIESGLVTKFIDILCSKQFREILEKLGGYELKDLECIVVGDEN